ISTGSMTPVCPSTIFSSLSIKAQKITLLLKHAKIIKKYDSGNSDKVSVNIARMDVAEVGDNCYYCHIPGFRKHGNQDI
ncbi:MAG: hypothetical protein J5886_05040, partial [Bacteroidales bacterium]|nr:hypothetical protein [Bacteroidales bacterium]